MQLPVICFLTLVFSIVGAVKESSASASDALNKFSFQLLSETIKEQNQQNIIISPYTVWIALSILNEGAQGKTRLELDNALQIPLDLERQQFAEMQKNIVTNVVQNNGGIILDALNNIFAKKEATIYPKYQELVNDIYGVKVESLDFEKNPDYAAQYINDKISQITGGRIPTVVDSVALRRAVMYIVSALYFKGLWAEPFKKLDERKPFYNEHGQVSSQASMMWITDKFDFGEILNGKAKAVRLPYKGTRLSMFIVLPQNDTVSSILKAITAEPITGIVKLNNRKEVHVTMPKFKITTNLKLNSALQKMGIRDVFTTGSNLAGLSPDSLQVSTVSHKAEIEVDEEGTVATGVTTIEIVPTSLRIPEEFNVDKPFLYFVHDRQTESVLFMGMVSNPQI